MCLPRYHYKMRPVVGVQIVANGDVIQQLVCGHVVVWIEVINTNTSGSRATISEDHARAVIGQTQPCFLGGGDFGDQVLGFIIRDRYGCGAATFVPEGHTATMQCTRCHRPLDVGAIAAEIGAHPCTGEQPQTPHIN